MPKRNSPYRDGLLEDLKADPKMAIDWLKASLEDSHEMFLLALREIAEANDIVKATDKR